MHWIAGVSTIAAALVAAGSPSWAAAPLSPERLQEAIDWGHAASDHEVQQYLLKVAPAWTLNFDTPFLRVAQMARAWAKRGRQLKLGDVPDSIVKPEVYVYALALQQPTATIEVKSITDVVIRKPGAMESVSPIQSRSNLNRARGRNDFRPAKIARSVEATFASRDFAVGNEIRISFEDGSHDTVVLTRAALAAVR